ncbi:DUF5723 family protein [Arundinibacter roseus]|uniref:DUF5723 domain-containing protein n=1 Tax=Arundinibacter roseus TaxID=2070510 RepID=A0A4V2XAL6_9BACT|nr:DUF5723 family protein [Arundinibacter roseus]TDB68155.1 hypothetical protein EZE20_04320 [Arundinibacter roseus]
MKYTRSSLFFLLSFLALELESYAQGFQGLASQYYGGFYSVYQNPAFLNNSPQKFQLHVGTVGVHLDNNYVRYNAPFTMLDLLRGRNSRPLDPYDLEEIRNGKPKNGTLTAEVRGPALAFKLGEKTSIAFMSRIRSGFQVSEASERLMGIARLGLANASNLQDLGYLALYASNSENRFNITSQAYSELGFSLSQTVAENETYRLTIGGTVKRFFGYAGGYIKNQTLNYRLLPDPNTVNGAYMQVDRFEATMGYTDVDLTTFPSPGKLFGQKATGKGWGLDVGFSYELRDEDSDKQPSFRLSASLIDAGKIVYDQAGVKNYDFVAEDRQITEEEWRGYSSPREGESQLAAFGRVLEEEFDLTEEKNTGSFTLAAPTALNVSADFKLLNAVYVNATLIQGLKNRSLPQIRQTSLWAVIPRFETKKLALSIPLIRQNDAWAVGAGLRLGPLSIGSDNLLGLFSTGGAIKAQGVDVYAGLSFGLGQ